MRDHQRDLERHNQLARREEKLLKRLLATAKRLEKTRRLKRSLLKRVTAAQQEPAPPPAPGKPHKPMVFKNAPLDFHCEACDARAGAACYHTGGPHEGEPMEGFHAPRKRMAGRNG